VASLRAAALFKRFGSAQAVSNVSFDVPDGSFFVLLGPAGAGKTTTLKLISGVEQPDAGDVFVGAQCVTGVPAEHRDLAMVFESYALYPNMTVRENLAFPLRAPVRKAKLTRAAVEERVKQVAETLEIGQLLDRYTWQLSGGQRQRVALGRVLVREPVAFLMDEPIAHLDAKLRHAMRSELKRLQKDMGVTTVLATPDYAEAMALADEVVILREGFVQQAAPPLDVFRRPANTFVAHLMGDPPMNLRTMELRRNAEGLELLSDGLRLSASGEAGAALDDSGIDREVVVGLRPSDLFVEQANVPSGPSFQGRVVLQELRGSRSVIVVDAGGTTVVAVGASQDQLEWGTPVTVRYDPARLHFFNPADGSRVPAQTDGVAEGPRP
jgi:multiple sugar transport system ATP-binding protein